MQNESLSRRRFLLGTGAVAAAIPWLVTGRDISGFRLAHAAQESPGLERARREGVRLGFSGGAPFSILQPDGSMTGAGPELAMAVLRDLGVQKVEGARIDFAGLIPALLANQIDMIVSATNITPVRCQQVTFANPFIVTLNSFATRKDRELSYASFGDVAAAGARLGVIEGSVDIGQAKRSGIADDRLLPFPDVASALSGLRDDRVDAVIASIVMLRYIGTRVGLLDTLSFSEPFTPVIDGKTEIAAAGVVFRQADQDFADLFSGVQAQLVASGEALRLMAPFGVDEASIAAASQLTTAQLCSAA